MDDNTNADKKSLADDFDETADLDDSKAKFLNGKQGLDSTQVTVEIGSNSDASFTGLGKDELEKFATDPFWVRTRMILFIVFWVGWFAMLAVAIIIIVFAPKCPERPNLKWYQTDVIYQINPKSFKDTSDKDATGAGVGDIAGISSKMEYLTSLGVNAFWINSVYKSGNLYDGNDVEDHKAVDEMLGTMEGLKLLRKNTKKKGMKMVMDFIPNHTGKKHEWFVKSEAKDADYADFYIWADGIGANSNQTGNPPNNWVTEYGTPAWSYSTTRKQWYYHSYLPDYPDLNLRNEDVLKQLDGVLKFWLDFGVDGLAVQGIQRLVEHNVTGTTENTAGEHTRDQMGNMDLVTRWRAIVDSYSDKPGRERGLIASVKSIGNNTKDYHKAGIHVVLSDALIDLDLATCNQECLKTLLEETDTDGRWRGWMVGNENSPRFGSMVSKNLQKAVQTLHMLLPGTAVIYYGDEIAMENGVIPAIEQKDPVMKIKAAGRDEFRTPMLWNANPNAGFCADGATPWLPVNADYAGKSVEYNGAHKVGYTILNSFKDLVALRAKEAFQFGSFEVEVVSEDLLYITRKAKGFPSHVVVINRGAQTTGLSNVAETLTLEYDSAGEDVGEVYDTKTAPIGFKANEVYAFSY